MSIVPSTTSPLIPSVPQGLLSSFQQLRQAFGDRRALDDAIALKDAMDWVDLKASMSSSSSAAPDLKASARASGGRSRGGGKGRAGPGKYLNKRDLAVRPPSNRIPDKIPRNFLSQVVYDLVKIRQTYTTLTTGVFEQNQTFSLSLHPQSTSWAALFDQWCVLAGSVTLLNPQAPGSTAPEIEVHTALDFDNITNLGSLTTIDDYDSSQVDILGPGSRVNVTRSVKPCLKTSASGNANGALLRTWCDSASPSSAWYGIRCIFAQTTTAVTFIYETSIWFGFRGRI